MIVSDNGGVCINGAVYEVLADFTSIIKGVYNSLIEGGYPDSVARETIAHAGKLAFASNDEIEAEAEEAKRRIKELFEGLGYDKE